MVSQSDLEMKLRGCRVIPLKAVPAKVKGVRKASDHASVTDHTILLVVIVPASPQSH